MEQDLDNIFVTLRNSNRRLGIISYFKLIEEIKLYE